MAKKKKYIREERISHLSTENTHFNWFPGHMMKAMKKIKEKMRAVDIMFEIRDARSPLVTGNTALAEQVGNKSRLIIFNKAHLADPETIKLWVPWFESKGVPFIFLDDLEKNSLNNLIKSAKEIVNKVHLASNPGSKPKSKLKVMIIGLPNTGKSTIINRLAGRDASRVADKPGQTQQQIWVNASEGLEILDTPGVMPPQIKTREQGLWLAAIHAIPEKIADKEDTACYILEYLIQKNPAVLEKQYNLEKVNTELVEALNQIAKARGCILKQNEFDYDRVYKLLLVDFRAGKLGPISFGLPPVK